MKIVNTTEFNEIIKSGTTLVDFYADWCGPCKALAPVLEDLANEYKDVEFIKVNCDDNMDLASQYGVMSIPAIFVFKDGEIIGHTGGYRDLDGMRSFMKDTIK